MEHHRITPDLTVLSDSAEVPGLGFLPVNTFVLHSEQPVVVDTGLSTPGKDFVADLSRVIDPEDVRWIWLTHPDRDHTGGLWELLDAAPNARLVTTFLGVGILSCEWEVPLHRCHFLNPGDTLDVGDRVLTGFRPPLFDSPATVGFVDGSSGALISSDCFGGPMPSMEIATGGDAHALSDDDRRAAQLLWAAVDSPWVHSVDPARYQRAVGQLRALDPSGIFSTHLPPAVDMNARLFDVLLEAPDGPAFVGPDQAALEGLLASFEPALS
jgi:glyoxylase-like metal-dependent hydrolase (beta-lactamase superfamily II)